MTKSLLQLILLKGKGRRKEKVARRARLIQMTFVITAKNLIIGRNILLLSLSRMIPNMKMIWVMVVGEQLQQHSEQWVLDSGCSYHIYPHKSWFVTYERKSGGNVLMGNNVHCKSTDIHFIQIGMHDGTVRTLTKVCHVPELNKNLVFIGAIDSKGFFLLG